MQLLEQQQVWQRKMVEDDRVWRERQERQAHEWRKEDAADNERRHRWNFVVNALMVAVAVVSAGIAAMAAGLIQIP